MNKEEKNKSMLLISNLYPSEKHQYYGTFVKNFYDISNEYFDIDKVVLYKADTRLEKIVNYIKFYFKIFLNVLGRKYDVVYVHYISHVSLPLLICKKLKEFTLYINVHGSDVVPTSKLGKKLLPYTFKILNKAQRIIVPSSYYGELVEQEFNVDKENIRIYASGGINDEIFFVRNKEEKKSILKEFGLEENKKYIGFASRIDTEKGWEILIDSINIMKQDKFDYLKEFKFIIVGKGKDYGKMLELIEEYDIKENIILMDLLPQRKLAEFYSIIEYFVFPSYRKAESLGLVGIEAMACGTPIIASNMAGPATYVKNNINGFLFKPKDSQDLYENIIKCIKMNEIEYLNMKLQCLSTAKQFTPKAMKNIYENIFDEGVI